MRENDSFVCTRATDAPLLKYTNSNGRPLNTRNEWYGVFVLSLFFFNTRPSTLRDERFFMQTRVSSLSRIRFRVAFRAFTSPRACACAWTFCTDVSFFPARRSEKKNLGCIKKGKKYTRRERNKKKKQRGFWFISHKKYATSSLSLRARATRNDPALPSRATTKARRRDEMRTRFCFRAGLARLPFLFFFFFFSSVSSRAFLRLRSIGRSTRERLRRTRFR